VVPFDVRFGPKADMCSAQACLHWANSELVQRNSSVNYSSTSSAATSNDGGIVRPSALAVLRLMVSSTLVDC